MTARHLLGYAFTLPLHPPVVGLAVQFEHLRETQPGLFLHQRIEFDELQIQRLREELPRLGFDCVTPEGSTSPIITFTMADGGGVQDRLVRAGVDVRVGDHFVRFSPSVYNDMTDIERALEALS